MNYGSRAWLADRWRRSRLQAPIWPSCSIAFEGCFDEVASVDRADLFRTAAAVLRSRSLPTMLSSFSTVRWTMRRRELGPRSLRMRRRARDVPKAIATHSPPGTMGGTVGERR